MASIRKVVIIATLVGFLVPWFWLWVMFMMFNARDGQWVYWIADLTCPSYFLPEFGFYRGDMISPFVNAGLYGLVASLWIKLRAKLGTSDQRLRS